MREFITCFSCTICARLAAIVAQGCFFLCHPCAHKVPCIYVKPIITAQGWRVFYQPCANERPPGQKTRKNAPDLHHAWRHLDQLDILFRNPALAAVGQLDVGEAGHPVQDFHLGAFVQDEQVLGRLPGRGAFDRGDRTHHDGLVLAECLRPLPLREIPAQEGQQKRGDAREETQPATPGAPAQQEQQASATVAARKTSDSTAQVSEGSR